MAQLDDWYADPNFNDDEELKKQAAAQQAQLDAARWQAQARAYGVNTPTAPTYQDDASDSGNYAPQPSAPQDTTQDARDRRQTIYTPQDFGGSSMQDDASDGGSRQTVYAPSDFERTADAQDRAQANQTHIYEPTVAPTYQDDQSDSGANTTIYQPTQDARDRQDAQKPQTNFYLQPPTQDDATNDWFGAKLPNATQSDATLGDVAQKISDSGAIDFAVGAAMPQLTSLYAGNQLRNKIAPDGTARLPLDAPETRLGRAERQIINPQSSVKQIGEGLLSATGELANFGANLVKAGLDKLAQAAPDLSGGQEYFRDGVTGMTAMNPKMVYEKGRQAEANANSAGVALDSKYIPADVTDKAQYAIDKTSSLMVSATHEQRVAAITRVLNGENPNVVVWGMDKPAETAFEDEKKAYATAVTDRLDAVSKIAYTNAINAGKTDLEAGKEAAYYREQEARKISANRRIDSEEDVVASALSSMLLDPSQIILPAVTGKVFGTLVKEAKGITAGKRMASVADEGAAAAVKAYTTGTPLWIAKAGESENVAAKAVAEVFENVGGLAKSTPATQVAKYQESAYKVVGLVVNDAQSADEVAAALNGLAKNPDALVSRFGNISKSVDAEVARPILEATLEDLTSAARKYQTDKGFNAVGFMNEADDAFRTAAQSLVPAAERNAFENTALGVKGLLSKFQLRTPGYAMRNAMSDTAVAMLDGLDMLKSPKTVEAGLQKWGITTSRIAESAGGISQDARAIASVGEKGLINKANELADNIPGLKQIGNASQKFEAQRNKAAMLSALEQEMPKYWQPKLTPDEIAVLGERAPVIERELADVVTGKDLRRVLSTHAAADKPADTLYIGHLMSDPTALPISTQKQIAADLSAAVKEGKSAEEAAAMIKAKYADEMTQTLNGKLLDAGEVYRPRINTKLEAGEDLSEAMLRERNLLRDSMVKSGAATPEEAEQMLNASIESYAKQERGAIAAREGMNQTARASNDPRMIDALHHTAMEEQAIRAEGRLETDRLLKEAYARIDEADANKASGAVKRGIWDDYNRANSAQLDEKFGRINDLYKEHTAKIAAGELDGYSSAKSSLEQQLKAWEGELNTPELKGAWRDAADAGRKKIDTARADAWGTAKSIVEDDANLSQSAHDVMYRASEYEEIAARQATAKKANLKANMRAKEITFAQYNEQVGQVWTDHFAQVEQRYQIATKELKAVEVVEGNIAPKLAELGYPPEEVQRMIANMKTGDGVPEIVNILESKTSFDPTKSLPKWKGGIEAPPANAEELLSKGRFENPQDALDWVNQAKNKTKSDNFKQWFGDWQNDPANASKVVNEKGEPLVVYHGTTSKAYKSNDFTEFNTPAFFADSPKDAEHYFGKSKVGNATYPVYLDIKNPFKISDVSFMRDASVNPQKGYMFLENMGLSDDEIIKVINDAGERYASSRFGRTLDDKRLFTQDKLNMWREINSVSPADIGKDAWSDRLFSILEENGFDTPAKQDSAHVPQFYTWSLFERRGTVTESQKILQAKGYDGATFSDFHRAADEYKKIRPKTYVAFEPTQIKSSIGNSGEFSPQNANILDRRTQQWDNVAYELQQKVDEAAGVTHEQAALRNAVKQTAENESIYEAAQMANNAPPETRAILKQTVADAAQRSAANSLAATDDIDKGLNAAVQAHAEAYFGHSGSEPYLWNSIKAYQEENGIKVIAGLKREANIETLRAFSKDLNLDPSKLVNASERSTSEIIAAARKAHPEAVDAVLAAPKTRNGTITTKAWKELEAQGLVAGKPQSVGEFLKTLAPEAFRSEITADDAIKATVRATFEHNMNPAEMPDLVTHTERKARKALDEIAQGVSNPDFWDKRYTPVANREQTISNLMSRLEPELNSARHMAINVAERRTGYAMLNYSDKRNFDTLISMVSPYSYWGLRQARNTVFRVLENPMLVANYARVRDAEKRALKESGMRQRLEGMAPVLNTDVGRVFVNVVDPILPFSDLVKDVYDDPNEQKTWQQSVYDYLQMTGLAPGSHVDTPIRALNLLVSAKAGTPEYDKQVAEYGSESVRSPLPQIGMVTAATVLAGVGGVGGVDLDQMARQKMGLPEAAGFTAYRTMRALSDMAATEQGAPTFNKRTYYLAEALVDRNQKTGWIALQKTMTPKDVAKQLNISEPEAAAALDLARKAIEIETKQTAIRTLGSGVFGFKTQVQTQGEELRNQQQRDERASAYDPLTGYGSRKELIDFRDRNPTSDISRGQYAVLPGEDGDPMRSYFRDVQNEASKAFDTLKDETIKRNPADRNAGYAIDAAKKYALSQIGNDKNAEPFNWQDVLNQAKSGKWTPPTTTTGQANASDVYTPRSVYGATPQETAQIRFNEAVREIASTEPKREKFVRADGSVDYEAYKAADKSWKEDVTHIAATNDTVKQIIEQAGKDNPYAAELLKTKLAGVSYGDVQKYFQQYDTPLEAMQRAYNDTVYGGAMDAYAKTKDSDPRAYNKTVGAVKTMSDKELAALVQGVYQGRWTDAELQDALKGVSMPALKDVITANLPKDKQEARQMSDKFYELRDKLMPPGKGASGYYDDPVIAALLDGQANDYATTEEYRQGIQRLIVLNKKYGTGERTPAWNAAEASNDKLKDALTQKYGDGWQQLWQDYGKAKAGAERAQLIAKNPQLQGLITDRAKWEAAYPEWADYYGKNAKSTAQGSTSYSSGGGGTGGVVGESGKRYANTPQGQLEKLADEKLPKNAVILNDPDVKAALGSATGKYATASQIAAAQQKITAWAQQNAGDYGTAKKQSQTINSQLQKQFGEDINLLYQYDAMSAKDASAFYKAHPEISAMLDARNQLGAQNAEYQKYFLSGNSGSTTTRASGGGGGGRAPAATKATTITAKTPRIYAPSDLVGTSQATSKQNTSSGAKSNSPKAPTIYMPSTAKTGSAPTPASATSTENQQKSDAWKELKALMDDVVPSGESGKEAKQIPIVSIVLGSTRANTQLDQYYQAIDAIKSWANANGTDDPSGAWQRAKGQASALDKLLRSKYGDDSVALLYQYDTAKSATARINVAKQYPVVNELVTMRVKFGNANKEYAYYYLGGDKATTTKAPMPVSATSGKSSSGTGQTASEKWTIINEIMKKQYEAQSKIKGNAPPPKLASAGKYQGGAAKVSGVYG